MTPRKSRSWSILFVPTKAEVQAVLVRALPLDLADAWWDIKLPTLDYQTPNEAWAAGAEERVYERAKEYSRFWD